MDQKIEDLRLDGDRFRPAPELAPISVKYMIGKEILHVCALPDGL
ncbi:MAG TPA: hypothetical protein VF772_25670 [Terriglobales bacterium]